jgi:hypothetical protein
VLPFSYVLRVLGVLVVLQGLLGGLYPSVNPPKSIKNPTRDANAAQRLDTLIHNTVDRIAGEYHA